MGQAEAVHAWIGETEREPGFLLDAPAIISWKFPGGRYGSLEVVYSRDMEIWSRYYAQDDRVEITGTRGVIEITRGHGKLFDRPPVILYRDRQTRSFSDMEVGWEQSFILSTRHFIDALHAGGAARAERRAGLRSATIRAGCPGICPQRATGDPRVRAGPALAAFAT